ncbi:uncharacterized protein J3D65DRAFT_614054 [Phyllosticta citribraziliensis]|uniref:Rad60/SUMO-like domain-containing protein n=1 Tax=Phyllosticta citribraziliensis TaxID=989973 RepID=A0ABR1M4L4_9PEZI
MPDSDTPPDSIARKPRRQFFKKPSWQVKKDDDDPTSLFDGSKQTYSAIRAEEERKRKEEEERRRKEEERKRQRELEERKNEEHQNKECEERRQDKRRKISRDSEDAGLDDFRASVTTEGYMAGKSESPSDDKKPAALSSSPPTKRSSTSLSSRYEEFTKRSESIKPEALAQESAQVREGKRANKDTIVIDLDDSDTAEDASLGGTKEDIPAKPVDPDDDIDESDLEIREMIRQSRRKKRLAEEQRARATPPAASGLERQGSASSLGLGTPQSPSQPDPPVQLFIQPRIPNTKPLLVTRRLSQRLQEVREAWCRIQEFDEEMTRTVFLTYRGIQLYDVNTLKSLGLSLNSEGQLVNKYLKHSDPEEDANKIALIATTKEIHEAEKEESRRMTERHPTPEPEPEPEEKRIKVVIKTKDQEDCKFIVKLSTEFGKMAKSAMNRMKLTTHLSPYLCFDGERLDPDGTMADLDDFEDEEAIDMFFE